LSKSFVNACFALLQKMIFVKWTMLFGVDIFRNGTKKTAENSAVAISNLIKFD
jgi:hypothetical protein